MLITQANDYAIRSLVFLMKQPENKVVPTKYVAAELKIPYNFLAKIFRKLIKKHIVLSVKGIKGGVSLTGRAYKKNLKDIFSIIDGAPILRNCVYDDDACSLSNNCRVNTVLTRIQLQIDSEFEKVKLEDLL